MKKIVFIFVSPEGLIHTPVGNIVQYVTKSDYAHVGIIYDTECLLEAIAPKVCLQPHDKYDFMALEHVDRITFYVTDVEYEIALDKGKSFIGYWYGLDKCLVGAAHDLMGELYSDWLADKFNSIKSIDCSGLATEIASSFLYDLKINDDSDEITPEDLRNILLDYINGEKE